MSQLGYDPTKVYTASAQIEIPGAGLTFVIPADQTRTHLLWWNNCPSATAVPIRLIPTALPLAPFLNNQLNSINPETHGPLAKEEWRFVVGGPGQFFWYAVMYADPQDKFVQRGGVDWYRLHLEQRRREQMKIEQSVQKIPECAKFLLETPLQHELKRQGQQGFPIKMNPDDLFTLSIVHQPPSAVGGGGGENGGDALQSASPDIIGD